IMFQAARARCAMTPPRDPATLTGAARRSGASFSAVARTARARSRRAVLAAPSGSDGCPLRSLPLVAGALHCKRATAEKDASRAALVTPAGCARRQRDRGATPEFLVKGLPPKNGARWERSKTNALPLRGSGRKKEVRHVDGGLPWLPRCEGGFRCSLQRSRMPSDRVGMRFLWRRGP